MWFLSCVGCAMTAGRTSDQRSDTQRSRGPARARRSGRRGHGDARSRRPAGTSRASAGWRRPSAGRRAGGPPGTALRRRSPPTARRSCRARRLGGRCRAPVAADGGPWPAARPVVQADGDGDQEQRQHRAGVMTRAPQSPAQLHRAQQDQGTSRRRRPRRPRSRMCRAVWARAVCAQDGGARTSAPGGSALGAEHRARAFVRPRSSSRSPHRVNREPGHPLRAMRPTASAHGRQRSSTWARVAEKGRGDGRAGSGRTPPSRHARAHRLGRIAP